MTYLTVIIIFNYWYFFFDFDIEIPKILYGLFQVKGLDIYITQIQQYLGCELYLHPSF
jgi:hypothetical protein